MKALKTDNFKDPDGDGYTKEGCYYSTKEELVMQGFIDWCGCGNNEIAGRYLLQLMQTIDDHSHDIKGAWEKRMEMLNHPAGLVVMYELEYRDWIEHGSNIYGGWLSEEGKEILGLLKEVYGLDTEQETPEVSEDPGAQ